MDTPLGPTNPFGHNRHGFAWEQVPAGPGAHLDFGCYEGKFLALLDSKGLRRRAGVDAYAEAIRVGRERYPDLDLHHVPAGERLPFEDGTFQSASLLDVLEHVADQKSLLAELRRILAPGGLLIITVPQQHVFSWLDRGNYKFRFPRLHRWYFCRHHSRAEYEYRYVNNPDGLIGDISADKRWHEHFTPEGLRRLLAECGFEVVLFDGSGLFTRVIDHLRVVFGRIPPLARLLDRWDREDARRFKSMNLFCVARKTD